LLARTAPGRSDLRYPPLQTHGPIRALPWFFQSTLSLFPLLVSTLVGRVVFSERRGGCPHPGSKTFSSWKVPFNVRVDVPDRVCPRQHLCSHSFGPRVLIRCRKLPGGTTLFTTSSSSSASRFSFSRLVMRKWTPASSTLDVFFWRTPSARSSDTNSSRLQRRSSKRTCLHRPEGFSNGCCGGPYVRRRLH